MKHPVIYSKCKFEYELDRFLTDYSTVILKIQKEYPIIGSRLRYEHLKASHDSGLKALLKIIAYYRDYFIVSNNTTNALKEE
jgi:hypothetical protein